MRGFDRLLYAALLAGFIWIVPGLEGGGPATSTPRSVVIPNEGAPLPSPSPFDARVIVEVPESARSGTGSAFAIADGVWVTARHVVEGCAEVGLYTGPTDGVWAEGVSLAPNADLALLAAPVRPDPLRLRLESDALAVGARGYHVGYPQGRPGEVASRLLGREIMVTRGGRGRRREPVLAWVETSRTRGLSGSLGGLSGGPAFGADGSVVGVTVAEAPRRGRIYTAAPASVRAALETARAAPAAQAAPAAGFSQASYATVAEGLRARLQVAKVYCGAP